MTSNVPPIIEQIKENMMDSRNSENVRFNYRTTLENIRNFCDAAINVYERQRSGKRK